MIGRLTFGRHADRGFESKSVLISAPKDFGEWGEAAQYEAFCSVYAKVRDEAFERVGTMAIARSTPRWFCAPIAGKIETWDNLGIWAPELNGVFVSTKVVRGQKVAYRVQRDGKVAEAST